MNEQGIAYTFSLPEGQIRPGAEGATGLASPSSFASTIGASTVFTSGEECRGALRYDPVNVSVIVCNNFIGTMTPINLAGALCADMPERDVYLMEDKPTESLVFRARAAGIRGIIDSSQASGLLGVDRKQLAQEPVQADRKDPLPIGRPPMPSLPVVCPEPAFSDMPTAPFPLVPTATPSSSPTPFSAPSPLTALPNKAFGKGRIVGFFSGRGGVGKSTVSLMTALLARQRGVRVALVDLDLQFGDLDYLAGKEPSNRIQRIELEQSYADIFSCPLSDDALALIIPPDQPEQGERYVSAIPSFLFGLAAQRDLVVVNTGSFWTDVHARIVQCCDHLAFLMDQRATSIEACKQVVDLCVRMQAPQARFVYLLNGCGRHASLTPMDVTLALGGVEVLGLADGGPLVDELLALGCPMELLTSGNAFVLALEALLDTLMVQEKPETASGLSRAGEGERSRVASLFGLKRLFGGAHRVAT